MLASLARDTKVEGETRGTVTRILDDVRQNGLEAVFRLTRELDGVALDAGSFRVQPAAARAALAGLRISNPELIGDLEGMVDGIRRFAQAQKAALRDVDLELPGGGRARERWLPMRTAGVYIPGGRAFYPSTLAMTVIPAQVAGVGRIVGVTPPKPGGPDPLVLATAALLELDELYTVGGAQAVGWMVYGEPRVDLVAGPGNRFVAEAKRQLVGSCGIDSLAGPSEVLVIADAGADPATVAEDLLAQAEHDPDAAAVLLSPDPDLLAAVAKILDERVQASPRRAILETSLGRHGRLIQADRELAIAFAQAWAPEHLELSVADPEAWLPRLSTAGAVFMGETSAEVFGDYGAGPNHVLPTGGSGRFSSPLGVATFMKRQTVLELDPALAGILAPRVARLAEAEGLVHHAQSARRRALRHHS
ncbi:MAG: histidinol dehydrogenase [Holophaga sp.]|nr:histidinol dehydrogenase [Holophaga sp.]